MVLKGAKQEDTLCDQRGVTVSLKRTKLTMMSSPLSPLFLNSTNDHYDDGQICKRWNTCILILAANQCDTEAFFLVHWNQTKALEIWDMSE